MKKIVGSFLVVTAFFLVGFFLVNQPTKNLTPENIKHVKIAGQSVKVDLALTSAAQEQGLSGRSGLGENEGMLFIFAKPGMYAFWMKDMNFAIDMIWLSEDLKVVYIKKDALPMSYPGSFVPKDNAKYVLEVPAGFSEKNNLKEGDSAVFTY